MQVRCPGAQLIGAAQLPGHRFRFADYADIVADPHAHVDGVLWTITNQCLAALDRLEGYPQFYNRTMVQVLHKNQQFTAMVYHMNPGYEDHLPNSNYYDMVVEGYNQHSVPTDQINQFLDSRNKAIDFDSVSMYSKSNVFHTNKE